MSAASPDRRTIASGRILAHPLHAASGLAIVSSTGGRSEITFEVNDFTANVIDTLHGGILYAMVDVAAFMALLSVIPEGMHGVTADIQVSVLRAAKRGDTVHVRGWVDRVGRTLANMRAEAFVPGPDGERLIGTGTVVKSLIPAPY